MTRLTRRSFTRALGLAPLLGKSALAGPFLRRGRLRDRPRLAAIGVWNRGRSNLEGVLAAGADVTALADVDRANLEKAALLLLERDLPTSRGEADWRVLLDTPKDFDGVVISTPDHLHAPIASAALAQDLAVYCEKPLAHTVEEARTLLALARTSRGATQMGTQIHAGANYRRVVEAIRGGAIGDVREVHVLCSKSWSGGRFGPESPVPDGLAFDLWLGPAAARPYSVGLHPADWRKFWQYGTGTVGDMACHWLDLVHWALALGRPSAVSAEGPPPHVDGTPEWLHATWDHAATATRGAVKVHWWDGGRRPECAGDAASDCHLWLGSKGRLTSTYSKHEVKLDDPDATYTPPEPTIADSPGHYVEWVRAIEGGPRAECSFEYAAPLTEAVLLATVAYRAGGALVVAADSGLVAGPKGVHELVKKTYREGFELMRP